MSADSQDPAVLELYMLYAGGMAILKSTIGSVEPRVMDFLWDLFEERTK